MLTLYYGFRRSGLDGFLILMLLLYSLQKLLGYRKEKKALFWLSGIGLYAAYRILTAVLFGTDLQTAAGGGIPYWIYFATLFADALVVSFRFLEGSLYTKLIYISIYTAVVQLLKMVLGPLYQIEGQIPDATYALLDLTSLAAQFVILDLVCHLYRRCYLAALPKERKRRYLLILYLPFALVVYYQADRLGAFSATTAEALLALIIIPALLILYYMFASAISSYEEQRRLDFALTQTRAQVARYRFSIEIEDRLRKERHELKNNYFYIQSLLEQKRYEELSHYLNDVIGEKMEAISLINTGNTMLDYLLNRKIAEAKKDHIRIYSEILVPANLTVNEEVLSTILLNLLDNAIEASRSVPDPDIHISMSCKQGYLCCDIANKVTDSRAAQLQDNPHPKTTKADRRAHGLGIRIVEETVRGADGMYSAGVESNYYTARFMLPLEG